MSPTGGFLATAALRVVAKNIARTAKMLRSKIATAARPVNTELQPVCARSAPGHGGRQPVHPAARLRQQKAADRWCSSSSYAHLNAAVRRYLSTGGRHSGAAGPHLDRCKLPVSKTSRAVSRFTGRAPFAYALRPNLTGGALGRTAGGYSMPGGSARYFSHTPAAPAQVVQNVSQAMRAFWLSGQRARYDGVGPRGEKRYRAVDLAQEEARIRLSGIPLNAPGSFVDFQISPTITALSPLGAVFPLATTEEAAFGGKPQCGAATLNTDGFFEVLSVDFARALKDLASVMTDLKSLAKLGDLPVTLESNGVLRIRFPGVDAETVERLCDDAGVRRGVVRQDADFDVSAGVPIALRFPFAPDESCAKTITSPGGSVRSHDSEDSGMEDALLDEFEEYPWLSSSSDADGYESMSPPLRSSSGQHCSQDFDGLEGIYRFIEECDRARGHF